MRTADFLRLRAVALRVKAVAHASQPSSVPYRAKSGEVIDPAKVTVYRGGGTVKVKPGDIRVGKDGLVQTTHGPSLDSDPGRLARFGGTSKVKSIPGELRIVQRGVRDTHFEVVPKQPMTPQRYEDLVGQIVLE